MENNMKVYHKLIALALLGTVAFGTGVSGTVSILNSISTNLVGQTDITEAGNLIEPNFTITINNNIVSGYEIGALSNNNSQLLSTTVGVDLNKDGHNIDYKLECFDLASGGTTYANGTVVSGVILTDNIGTTPDILTSNNVVATPSIETTCTIRVDSDETYGELFAGSYEDTLILLF
jgi:hypothetical protein